MRAMVRARLQAMRRRPAAPLPAREPPRARLGVRAPSQARRPRQRATQRARMRPTKVWPLLIELDAARAHPTANRGAQVANYFMHETVKLCKIHGMLAHRAKPRQPVELFEVKMTKFRGGVLLCSLLSATAAISICAAAEHSAAEHAAADT